MPNVSLLSCVVRMSRLSLDLSREHAATILLIASLVSVFPVAGSAVASGMMPTILGATSLALTVLAFIVRRMERSVGRIAVALAIVGQVMLLTAAMSGQSWQLDSHMYYFVALAAIAAMVDLRALVAAAGAICLHHLMLPFGMPLLVYGQDAVSSVLERTLFHALAVALTTVSLGAAIHVRLRLVGAWKEERQAAQAAVERARSAEAQASAALTQTEQARIQADTAREEAEAALGRMQAETKRAERADSEAAALREIDEKRRAVERETQAHVIGTLREAFAKLAEGDLGARITGALPEGYEDLGDGFDSTLAALEIALQAIRRASRSITGETDEIASAATDLAHRTEEQAATLEEITRSTEQLTQLIRATAEDAGQAEIVMNGTGSEAQTGSKVMEQAIAAMAEIETSSREVRKITSMIEDIAFQTNLLALNAGVEAARAGDAGRGFAVVASEVRALAKRSSDAAMRINTLIMQSGAQIERGVALVHDTGGALEKIIASVEATGARISKIAAISDEQATGVHVINAALRDLDRVSQQNATMFEETTAACQTLRASARGLATAVERFSGDEGPEIDDVSIGKARPVRNHAA